MSSGQVYKYGLSLMLLIKISLIVLQAQKIPYQQASTIFGGQKIVKFREFSLEMTDEGKQILNTLAKNIRQVPVMIRNNMLIIQVFSCEKELKVKPYLGVCRGQVIIDYLVETIKMPRKQCLIQDTGASLYDKECLSGSGVNLYLRPGWEGID